MSKDELILSLNEIRDRQRKGNDDTELSHIDADNLLLDYINDEDIKKAFDELIKWYA